MVLGRRCRGRVFPRTQVLGPRLEGRSWPARIPHARVRGWGPIPSPRRCSRAAAKPSRVACGGSERCPHRRVGVVLTREDPRRVRRWLPTDGSGSPGSPGGPRRSRRRSLRPRLETTGCSFARGAGLCREARNGRGARLGSRADAGGGFTPHLAGGVRTVLENDAFGCRAALLACPRDGGVGRRGSVRRPARRVLRDHATGQSLEMTRRQGGRGPG
jgi:hypothetical protein